VIWRKMEIKNLREVLKQGAQFLEDNLKDGIINEGLLKTGKLGRSVNVEYRDDQQEPSYTIKMEDYGFYQDSGVSGTQRKFSPNPESLFNPGQFTSIIPWKPRTNLPFPVAKSIAEKGFRPRPFIVPAVNRTIENMTQPLTDAGAEDLDIEINELFTQNGAIVK